MRLGVIFPDVNSFYRKMGIEIFENYSDVQKLYERISKPAELNLKKTLIYEQTEAVWDEIQKNIAVLLTSVAFYKIWYDIYRSKPTVYYGSGVGVLSANVCAGVISLPAAVRMIRKGNWSIQASGNVCENAGPEELLQDAKERGLDCVIEIGPGNRNAAALQQLKTENIVFAYLDDDNDNGYILENFEYRKHFSNLYAARRMLGMAAATQNFSNSTENDEKIISAYNALRAFVDEVQKRQFTEKNVYVSDFDLGLCIDQIKVILCCKKSPKAEVRQRILMIQNEIALDLRPYFAEWF